ncbi:MAG TPA: hypothetical protein PL143_14575 [Rhodocyclaceae bacterium]|nr:hypothetical protein [Rhodocyclaceae bacterium]
MLGFALAAMALRPAGAGAAASPRTWQALATLGALALTAAAFLRWFS